MWLADSNILIRAASAIDHPLQAWLQDQLPAISVVTRIEILGFRWRLMNIQSPCRLQQVLLSCAASEKCRSAMRLLLPPAWNTG